ncbi:hypothetical protein [Flavisphingomonas formosensis]|uniref:hypothetical protein n=1 Tax=Flavisphingomonas formosensis TaxID=861534 RepID=UPI0012FBC581|nr:hypothetical protein [Sphingomonas formosensis]
MAEQENISTRHQPKGAAKNPSDTLDREADSMDVLHGDAGRAAEAQKREKDEIKLDSATAAIDEQARSKLPPDGAR